MDILQKLPVLKEFNTHTLQTSSVYMQVW